MNRENRMLALHRRSLTGAANLRIRVGKGLTGAGNLRIRAGKGRGMGLVEGLGAEKAGLV